ncbi:MAG: metallophosphoesterase [Aristaeellaceae bacterium]
MLETNYITLRSKRIEKEMNLAVCSDFHNGNVEQLCPMLKGVDAILIVGDLVDRHDDRTGGYQNAVRFLQEAPDIAPTFYSIGNHEAELKSRAEYWPHVEKSRVTVLDNRFVAFDGIVLGGLSSRREGPDASWLRTMAERNEFRLLMCHQPEYFERYIQPHDIDLTIAGHAHGGQVRLGRQGLFAPGQGIFPRLTSGFYFDERLLVSRGVTNATWAPRINCGCEVIILHLEGMPHA